MIYSVYVFLDRNNRPYYVGKTNSMTRRRKEHLAEIKKGNPLPKYNAARKILRQGGKFSMRTIRTVGIEAEAFRLEKYFIKKYRQDGYKLFNCTHGGPEESPMKINSPKKSKLKGIKFPVTKKRKKAKKKKLKKNPFRKLRKKR